MRDCNDGGAIYLMSRRDGLIVENNYIHDLIGTGTGLYLDNRSAGYTVRSNVVHSSSHNTVLNSYNTVFENNYFDVYGPETGVDSYTPGVTKIVFYGWRLPDYSGLNPDNRIAGTIFAALSRSEWLNPGPGLTNTYSIPDGDHTCADAMEIRAAAGAKPLTAPSAPEAVFSAIDDTSGTLSNVTAGMKYSVDGGQSWNDIIETPMIVTEINAEDDIRIILSGNGSTPDSYIQTIDITQAEKPTGLSGTPCRTEAQNDGQITGVTAAMEYKLSSGTEWAAITGETVTGLASGSYDVRVKADGTVLASPAETVVIAEHTCSASGEWKTNETDHWKLCGECGKEVEKEAHEFEWVIDKEATETEDGARHQKCKVCGYETASQPIPATGTGTEPGTDPGTEPGAESGTESGTGTSSAPGSNDNTKTGESSNIWLWFVLLLLSGGVLSALVNKNRIKF